MLSTLFVAIAFLNGTSCLFSFKFFFAELHVVELLPYFVELCIIFFNVVRVINYGNILLVMGSSLESPIKRASKHDVTVYNTEFIMHMKLRVIICNYFNASVGESLTVVSFTVHLIIIRYYADFDSSFEPV